MKKGKSHFATVNQKNSRIDKLPLYLLANKVVNWKGIISSQRRALFNSYVSEDNKKNSVLF